MAAAAAIVGRFIFLRNAGKALGVAAHNSARVKKMRLVCAALGVLGVLGGTATPLRSAPDADARYAALAAKYFAESFAASPVNATFTGIHTYDAQLGSYGPQDYAAQIARDNRYLIALGQIDPTTLSPDVALDEKMLTMSLRDDLLMTGTMATWKHKPDNYVGIASGAVFSLMSRNFAPRAVRLSRAIARENQIPAMFAQAEKNLVSCDADTAAIAYDDAMGTVSFFTGDAVTAFKGAGDAATQAAFRRSTARAAAATRAFATFIKARFVAHPTGTFAIGAADYAARLRDEEGIEMPLDQYLAVGMAALKNTHERMVATAKQIDPHATVEQVVAKTMRVHPTAAGQIPAAASDLVKLRAFLVAKHIIDLPPDADITVTLTPAFERSTTVASMDAPGPLETVATKAYYNVTPVDPRDSKQNQELYLQTFNDFERPIVSAHEVYPGHFTQYIIDKRLPLSLSKKLLGAASFVEGWAHYDEQMVVDEGWGNGDPRVRLMQLKEAILRNARYVVGVKLHTAGWTLAQAEHFFETEAFLDPADARIESRRGTQDATYGYYTLGKLEILKLRADYQKKYGDQYTLAKFHADLLAHGSPPIPLLRPLLLGADDDGKIL
jgi:uncharacterized protein (DUF885 family)